jgi:hypothetical protein
LLKAMNSVAGTFPSVHVCLWYFLENLIAASFASVPEFAKNTRSAKEEATSRFASSTCSSSKQITDTDRRYYCNDVQTYNIDLRYELIEINATAVVIQMKAA